MAQKIVWRSVKMGGTFSELKDIPNQVGAIVVMSDLLALKTGKGHYMATYHHRAKVNGLPATHYFSKKFVDIKMKSNND